MVTVTSPRMAHNLAFAMGQDAANVRMRKAGRATWNRADYNLSAEVTQKWYANFNILNADSWMPEGYEWCKVGSEYVPMVSNARKARAK
jgi:hypothetical protein